MSLYSLVFIIYVIYHFIILFPQEIIQNAEDAGATELVFLLDKNFDNDSRNNYTNEKLRKYQVIWMSLYVW